MGNSNCPKCRAPVDSSDEFCRKCACDLRPAPPPHEDPDVTGIGAASSPEPPAQLGEPAPAQVFFGHFEVVRRLGSGGMGTVYAARDTRLDGELVALKILHPELARNPEARARFKREVIVARKLGNPDHVVRVYAPHEDPGDDALLGFSMELLDGASLADHLAPAGPSSPLSDLTGLARLPWAAALARQIALALDPLHAQGLVHRDIKPSNIMVLDPVPKTPDNLRCKLLDFGVVWHGADSTLTGRAQPGTVDYRAPELGPNATGAPSPSSDLFGLGKVLYWALTGKPPIFLYNLTPPSNLIPGLPDGLDEPLLSCFGEPDMRPGSAGALADVFEGVSREVEIVEAERQAQEESERKAQEEAERKAQEEAERRAQEEAERRAQEEAERRAQEAAERKAQEEAERRAQEAAERKAQEEAERRAQEAAERKAQEAAERKAQEEAERKAQEEAERKAQEEAERKAQEEAERKAQEAADLVQREPAPPSRRPWLRWLLAFLMVAVGGVLVTVVGVGLGSIVVLGRGGHREPVSKVATYDPTTPEPPTPAPREEPTPAPTKLHSVLSAHGYGMEPITPSKFYMGSPDTEDDRDSDETRHPVTLTRPFEIGHTEVTQALYEEVMDDTPSKFEGSDHPVETVSWCDAVWFCNRLSDREDLTRAYVLPGFEARMSRDDCNEKAKDAKPVAGADGYRLPTEAEWEYAARGGEPHVYSGSSQVSDVAWVGEDWGRGHHAVGGKEANEYDLQDMSGNVWEWVWDWYGDYEETAKNPTGPEEGSRRVRRGGSWNLGAWLVRVANRSYAVPGYRSRHLGFRLARSSGSP